MRHDPVRSEYITHQVETLLKAGQISRSHSPWSSPVVLALKQNDGIRFCIDYRRLNEATIRDVYPLPRIDDVLSRLNGQRYFSTLDMAAGYWQVPLDEASKEKTAFVTRDGLFHWNVMPFGLTNAPPHYQRMMDVVLAGLKWYTCLVYLDDIIIFSKTFEEHLNGIDSVMTALAAANLSVKFSKCAWAQPSLKWLGHIISDKGIEMDPKRAEKVQNFPTPFTPTQLMEFLGLAGTFRIFIDKYGKLAAPLQSLLRDENRPRMKKLWASDPRYQQAFEQLKKALASPPILAQPDFDNDFTLQTDGSNEGLGATLLQTDKEGKTTVICYLSRSLAPAEKKWTTTEIEALAVIWACDTLRHYLIGKKFLIETDHAALVWALRGRTIGRLGRWALLLSEFDFEIKHRPGASNKVADALSRNFINMILQVPIVRTEEDIQLYHVSNNDDNLVLCDQWKELQHEDEFCREILEELKKPPVLHREDREVKELDGPAPLSRIRNKSLLARENAGSVHRMYFVHQATGLLYRRGGYCEYEETKDNSRLRATRYAQLVVPTKKVMEILFHFHDHPLAAHGGVHKTFHKIRERFWWDGMRKDVTAYVKTCETCQRYKPARMDGAGLLFPAVPKAPFHRVHIDLAGPFNKTPEGGYTYVLVMVCAFSGWPILVPLRNCEAADVADALVRELYADHLFVPVLVHDRGSHFDAALIKALTHKMGTRDVRTAPYHPQANGKVEVFIRSMKQAMATMGRLNDTHTNWHELLPLVEIAYRTSELPGIGYTPYEIVFGLRPTLPGDRVLDPVPQEDETYHAYVDRLQSHMKIVREHVATERARAAQEYKDIADRTRFHVRYEVGDKVWMWDHTRHQKGLTSKFLPKWLGPYTISRVYARNAYDLQSAEGATLVGINVADLRPYHPRERPVEPVAPPAAPAAPAQAAGAQEGKRADGDVVMANADEPPAALPSLADALPQQPSREKKQRPAKVPAAPCPFKKGEMAAVLPGESDVQGDKQEPYWIVRIDKIFHSSKQVNVTWYTKTDDSERVERPAWTPLMTEKHTGKKTVMVEYRNRIELKSLMGHSFTLDRQQRIPYDIIEMIKDELEKVKRHQQKKRKRVDERNKNPKRARHNE